MQNTSNSEPKFFRKNFGKIKDFIALPNLIAVQKNSYEKFLNDVDDAGCGIGSVFKTVFPIDDFTGLSTLDFVSYRLDPPKFTVRDCLRKGITYSAPIKAILRLVVWLIDEDTGSKEVKSIKEQEVYLGDIPLMTDKATFIINGTERVIVSQLHRSPGVFFDHDNGKATNQNKLVYSARIIPYRGSWLDFEFDTKDNLFFRIDRKRKLPITIFLKALGLSKEEIIKTFYPVIKLSKKSKEWLKVDGLDIESYKGKKLSFSLYDASTKELLVEAEAKITALVLKKIKDAEFLLKVEDLSSLALARQYQMDEASYDAGVLFENTDVEELFSTAKDVFAFDPSDDHAGSYLFNTFALDKNRDKDEALLDIHKVLRPGDPPSIEAASELFQSIFFQEDRYDLSPVGRAKLNERLQLSGENTITLLTQEDIVEVVRVLINMKLSNAEGDDIDHLGNRRIRSVGELVENQFRIGLVRVQRAIQERMNTVDIDSALPQDLINVKPLSAAIREFFGTSQLSQFMDQTNPLSEITHKRRLSALGPGGLSRDRAGFEVRDVHTSHYSRICPIETPEGQNIGLINSIATYAKVNKFGFLESPYRQVTDGKVTQEVVYLSASQEARYVIAQANAELNEDGSFKSDFVNCRFNGNYIMSPVTNVDFIDLSPKQVISVAASLIPFLENDDANRALMGSNMQRQAVPLLYPEAPVVGTGMEGVVARDSSACVVARNEGVVEKIDSSKIFIRKSSEDQDVDIYFLDKYQRSNQDTCINQKPIVKVGQTVYEGQVLADGPSTKNAELALGKNVLVGFMSWNGFNYEDSILISERIVRDDVFTSVHIEEFEITARDTRLGSEEITRDIPNVGEESLRNLDEVGIVNIGAEVKGGDILVGKVTPKSESPTTPEEKLLRAIFGEKAAEVKDSSLYVSPGVKGTVIDVRIYTRRGVEKDERTLAHERAEIVKLANDKKEISTILSENYLKILSEKVIGAKLKKSSKKIEDAKEVTIENFDLLTLHDFKKLVFAEKEVNEFAADVTKKFFDSLDKLEVEYQNNVEKIQAGDDLAQGVLKVVKVFVAVKRKLQPGDKMAGRHGNKGVISRIVPIEDMPYLEDGTPLDVVLNPLGVPSRMNVGQILETHLGYASYNMGKQIRQILQNVEDANKDNELRNKIASLYGDSEIKEAVDKMSSEEVTDLANNISLGLPFATPVFDGAKEVDIVAALESSGVSSSGQEYVYDGRTGERFDRKVTVGYIYMLKLHHLVDDKIHARSVGPYSLVTQQPLGGKSHFGGQRFGEMECWALQAYGAAYSLQEMLTVKSDDVTGRIKLYESVVRGDSNFDYGVPESFNVMIKELKSLCLNVDLEQDI